MSFEVSKVELREIRLPLKEPFRISSGVAHERRILLLQLTEVSGAEVWSECVAGAQPNYSPETIDLAWLALREWLVPRLLGARWRSATDATATAEITSTAATATAYSRLVLALMPAI